MLCQSYFKIKFLLIHKSVVYLCLVYMNKYNCIGIYLEGGVVLSFNRGNNNEIVDYDVRYSEIYRLVDLEEYKKYDIININIIIGPGSAAINYSKIIDIDINDSKNINKLLIRDKQMEIIKELRNKKIDKILSL